MSQYSHHPLDSSLRSEWLRGFIDEMTIMFGAGEGEARGARCFILKEWL